MSTLPQEQVLSTISKCVNCTQQPRWVQDTSPGLPSPHLGTQTGPGTAAGLGKNSKSTQNPHLEGSCQPSAKLGGQEWARAAAARPGIRPKVRQVCPPRNSPCIDSTASIGSTIASFSVQLSVCWNRFIGARRKGSHIICARKKGTQSSLKTETYPDVFHKGLVTSPIK